jgi:rhodanese-related sulfurtransferase
MGIYVYYVPKQRGSAVKSADGMNTRNETDRREQSIPLNSSSNGKNLVVNVSHTKRLDFDPVSSFRAKNMSRIKSIRAQGLHRKTSIRYSSCVHPVSHVEDSLANLRLRPSDEEYGNRLTFPTTKPTTVVITMIKTSTLTSLLLIMFCAVTKAFNPAFISRAASRSTLTTRFMSRKAGVASPEELKAFVAEAGNRLMVVDVRNPDAAAEPGDQKSLVVAALPSDTFRPQAVHLVWDRESDGMEIPDAPVDTPIITHCGGGGRGQKAMDFLAAKGFTTVLNGGGPKETECWAEFGEK